MGEGRHDLAAEFPEYKDRIRELKSASAHFRKLFDDYHDVSRTITRSEQRIDLLSEREEEKLRKRRLMLKDEIYSMLTQK